MPQIKILNNDVFNALSRRNPQKAYGPDRVPNIALKNCASVLTPCLVNLFYLILSTSVFPSCWKYACIQPIPKKGGRSNPSSYHPIALLSCYLLVVTCGVLFKAPHSTPMERSAEPPLCIMSNDSRL